MSDGRNRSEIRPGLNVAVVMKEDQRSGKLTEGIVKDILTKLVLSSPRHQGSPRVRGSRTCQCHPGLTTDGGVRSRTQNRI
jgi:uncharacterized repeat protein (TIGR03833 family)